MTVSEKLNRVLYILQDENNPYGTKVDSVMPETILDQVHDDQSPTNKTLREIIADLRQEIINGGRGTIVFPVTSVQGRIGDIVITKADLGLENVDNTADIDKPLSEPQELAIIRMLEDFEPEVDLSRLDEHLLNSNNPHGVTLNQINQDNSVTTLIADMISMHNMSTAEGVHADIRSMIAQVATDIDDIEEIVDSKLAQYSLLLGNHIEDPAAHQDLFEEKENRVNKVPALDSTATYEQYPSARAVVEFIAAKIAEYDEQTPDIENWIDDIRIVNTRSDLEPASEATYRKAFLIRRGFDNCTELAICRYQNSTYYWDYSVFTEHTSFNMDYFAETTNGLGLNENRIVEIVMDDATVIDHIRATVVAITSEVMDNYYTKEEIDARGDLYGIEILPGVDDGSIRYYVNHDQSTMSTDIFVKGLTNIAFKEKLSGDELEDNCIHHNHLADKAVNTDNIADKAVSVVQMNASYHTVLGNISDEYNRTVQEIPFDDFADAVAQIVGDIDYGDEDEENE